MKSKVIFLFFNSIIMQVVLTSCCGSIFGGNVNSSGINYFAITAIDATAVYDFELQESISDGDSINSEFLLIKLNLQNEYVASIIEMYNWGIMQGAYACSEPEPLRQLKSKIKSFTIKSDQQFQDHPAGFDLAEYATISPDFSQNSELSLPIQTYVDYENESFSLDVTKIIKINAIPENTLYHRFTIEIESEDGQLISSQTQQIKWW